jgi:hypothetical protein
MGRSKSREREPALDAAMGLDVYSLYAEFGSKQGLCEAALDHYARQFVPGIFPTFVGTEDEVRGCLICNAATELAPTPDLDRGAMDGYITRLAGVFVMVRAQIDRAVVQDTVDGALSVVES